MGFYPPTENPCVRMRENLKTKSCEYIVIYQDELYIASTTPEEISIFYKTNERSPSIQIFMQDLIIHLMQVEQKQKYVQVEGLDTSKLLVNALDG